MCSSISEAFCFILLRVKKTPLGDSEICTGTFLLSSCLYFIRKEPPKLARNLSSEVCHSSSPFLSHYVRFDLWNNTYRMVLMKSNLHIFLLLFSIELYLDIITDVYVCFFKAFFLLDNRTYILPKAMAP